MWIAALACHEFNTLVPFRITGQMICDSVERRARTDPGVVLGLGAVHAADLAPHAILPGHRLGRNASLATTASCTSLTFLAAANTTAAASSTATAPVPTDGRHCIYWNVQFIVRALPLF
jgi:hypothetical protein